MKYIFLHWLECIHKIMCVTFNNIPCSVLDLRGCFVRNVFVTIYYIHLFCIYTQIHKKLPRQLLKYFSSLQLLIKIQPKITLKRFKIHLIIPIWFRWNIGVGYEGKVSFVSFFSDCNIFISADVRNVNT